MPVATDDASTSSFSVGNEKGQHEPLQRPGRKIKRRHSVDFVISSPQVEEFDRVAEEDVQKLWYSRDEYDIIKARNSLIVKMVKLGEFEEGEDHSARGLEHKLRDGSRQRKANKYNALNAVLIEQDRQYNRGTMEPKKIAKAYSEVSGTAKESAFVNGLKDSEQSYSFAEKMLMINSATNVSSRKASRRGSGSSVCTETDTCSSSKNKTALKKLFRVVSLKRSENRAHRRASM